MLLAKYKKIILFEFFAIITFLVFVVQQQVLAKSLSHMSAPTLKQIVDAAMFISDKAASSKNDTKTNHNEKSSWLASSPTLGISYLKSDLPQGTDEAELSITLPFKSFLQSDIDNKLFISSQTTQQLLLENKRLILSGMIRQQLWQIKLANHNNEILQQKINFLSDLEQQYQQLFQLASTSRYPLLLIKKEKIDAQILLLESQQKITQLMQQYTLVTGYRKLPLNISEQPLQTQRALSQLLLAHPKVKKLDQDWFEQEQQINLTDNKVAPWNLSVNALTLTTANFTEQQIGFAAEVPLTFFDIKKQSTNSAWILAKGNYNLAKNSLLLTLQNTYLALQTNQQTLQKKQVLLLQAKSLSKAIITETRLLIDANQIDRNIAIRRMLEAFNTKAKLTTNQLLLLKNNALLNQAAGRSL